MSGGTIDDVRTRGSSSVRSRRCSARVSRASPSRSSRATSTSFRGRGGADAAARCRRAKADIRPRAMRRRGCPATRRAVRHRHQPQRAAGPAPRRLRRDARRPRAPRALLVPARARAAPVDVRGQIARRDSLPGRSLDGVLPRRVRGLVLPGRRSATPPRRRSRESRLRARRMGDRRRRPRQRPVPSRARGDPARPCERSRPRGPLLRRAVLDVPEERTAVDPTPPPLGSVVGAAFNLPARRHLHRDARGRRRLQGACPESPRLPRDVAVRFGETDLAAQARPSTRTIVRIRSATSADDVLRRFVAGDVGRRAQGAARAVQRPVATGARLVGRGVQLPWIPGPCAPSGPPWSWGLAPIGRSACSSSTSSRGRLAITPSSIGSGGRHLIARIVRRGSQLSPSADLGRALAARRTSTGA